MSALCRFCGAVAGHSQEIEHFPDCSVLKRLDEKLKWEKDTLEKESWKRDQFEEWFCQIQVQVGNKNVHKYNIHWFAEQAWKAAISLAKT